MFNITVTTNGWYRKKIKEKKTFGDSHMAGSHIGDSNSIVNRSLSPRYGNSRYDSSFFYTTWSVHLRGAGLRKTIKRSLDFLY